MSLETGINEYAYPETIEFEPEFVDNECFVSRVSFESYPVATGHSHKCLTI